jgi:hypothetical protein
VAAARLELSGQGLYRFGFYRGEREGPFLPEETRSLDRIFPHLQAVATICQATLEKQTEDCSSRFSRNGLAALKLGRNGFVTESNPAADRFIPDLFRLSRGRITLPSRSDQGRLDRAIATAVSENAASTVFRRRSSPGSFSPDCSRERHGKGGFCGRAGVLGRRRTDSTALRSTAVP